MHHHYVQPAVFEACKRVNQFLLTHEGEDGQYAYTYDALMEPGNERNRTCILPAPGPAKDGPAIARACGLQGLELKIKLVYVAAPPDEDGATDPIPEVTGNLNAYYE